MVQQPDYGASVLSAPILKLSVVTNSTEAEESTLGKVWKAEESFSLRTREEENGKDKLCPSNSIPGSQKFWRW